MKTNKVTLVITVQTFHVDSMPQLINQMNSLFHSEFESGQLIQSDGDTITWKKTTEEIEL